MNISSYVPIIGRIQDISIMGNDCCTQMVSMVSSNGPVVFSVSADTFVVDTIRLRTGMRVAGIYNPSLPVPLIFPPRYRAEIMTAVRPDENVMFSRFDRNLMSSEHTLVLNIGRGTEVVTANGQPFNCNPGQRELLVYYSITTKSIPAQTTPRKIIVFC